MIENFITSLRTAAQIEVLAYDWRRTFNVEEQWAPDVVRLLEDCLPCLFPGFEFVVQDDALLGRAEAFTRHPRIFARNSVVVGARNWEGRPRYTLTHELGHLLMHPHAPSPRTAAGNKAAPIDDYRRSAEWQANKFATYFLMPAYIVRQFSSAADLSEHCKVSLTTATFRFKEVGHIKPALSPEFEAFLADWKRKYGK